MGHSVVQRANDGFREHCHVWEASGMLSESMDERNILDELSAPTPAGEKRRIALQTAIDNTSHEFHRLGIEMNRTYASPGVYVLDEKEPFQFHGPAEDPILYYMRGTYPGRRLPHVWLNKPIPGIPMSAIDIAGNGQFSLFTGIGGEVWKTATDKVRESLSGKMSTMAGPA